LLIKDLIAVFYLGLQSATAFTSILKAAIVLVAHPGKPDRAAVFQARLVMSSHYIIWRQHSFASGFLAIL
jgi:hypothetical protein